ncbi:MAG: DUF5060 domain-containing protein [Xanthomonadales bacterium]|nr:DUF5060 domain-containing protein [Xanthomonadales bacterium]
MTRKPGNILNKYKWLSFLAAGLVYSSAAFAATVDGSLIKWHPLTISFNGPTADESDGSPNPFLDYRLQVTFTGPGAQQYVVPGFFDGDGNGGGSGDTWRVRFAPDEAGSWSYSASFRSASNIAIDLSPSAGAPTGFDGENGNFTITALDPAAPGFLKWGRLEYVGKHHLKFRDGDYWLKGGVDSPENFLGYKGFDNTVDQPNGASTTGLENGVHRYPGHVADWNPGDPLFTSADTGYDSKGIIGALNYLSSQQVNSIYFLPMNLGGDGRETYPFISPAGTADANTHYDISKLHQWNQVLNHAQEQGIALHFVLAETESGNENWLDSGTLGTQRKLYYRELIARFAYLLAVKWNLSEENDFSDAEVRAFADYISALDWAGHQLTFHTHHNNISQYAPHLGDARFDTTAVQYAPDNANSFVESLITDTDASGRPLVIDMDENSPAGTGLTDTNATDLRKRVLYDVYFSGGNIEWYFGYHALPLGGDMRTEDFTTRSAMYGYMATARQFMHDYLPFWDMQPGDSLLSGEDGAFGGGQVFYKPGEVYAVYLPDGNPSGTLTLPGSTFDFDWFNPRSGAFEGSQVQVNGPSVALGSPPSSVDEDWVALFRLAGNQSPTVNFVTPSHGQSFLPGATIPVEVSASDPDGSVSFVELYVDSVLVSSDSTAPYAWDGSQPELQNLAVGPHVLDAYAEDNDGGFATSSITINIEGPNSPPSASFLTPTDGQQFDEGVDLFVEVSASDSDGSVSNVRLYLDGNFVRQENVDPYQWNPTQDPVFAGMAPGNYTLRADATDDDGETTQVSIGIIVNPSNPTVETDHQAIADIPGAGTVTGTFASTGEDDDIWQSIRERESGGKKNNRHSFLEHRWQFNITPADSATLMTNAWSSGSSDGDQFRFEYSSDNSNWTEAFVIASTDPANSASVLLPSNLSGNVYIRVTDTDQGQGNRALDTVLVDQLIIRTVSGPGDPPAAPSNLQAVARPDGGIDLSWNDNSNAPDPEESGFEIERSTDGASWGSAANAGQDETSHTDTGLAPLTEYFYRIRAFNGHGESAWSNTASATTVAGSPISLAANGYKVKGRHTVDLDWSGASGNVDIYRDGGSPVASGVSGSNYTDNIGAKGGATYEYRVCETGGTSVCSDFVSVVF